MNKRNGSSPIGHPKNTPERAENIEDRSLQVRQTLAHLADVYALGGDTTTQQMRAQLVKLHTTGKRWYVSYYTKSPSGKNERRRSYGYVNAEKDLNKRMQLLMELQNSAFIAIQKGEDFNERPVEQTVNIYKITDRMLSEKHEYLKKKSYDSIRLKLAPWKKWLLATNVCSKHPTEIRKIDILNYRNWLLKKNLANRTINNYVDEVTSVFNYIMQNLELIRFNPCSTVNKLPSRSEKHVSYTIDEANQIATYLREKDPLMLFFIKLVSYSFLRVDETRTLQIKHIDFKNFRIMLTAENNKVNHRKWKLIPEILKEDFQQRELHRFPKDYFVFGKNGKPGPINIGPTCFTKRFKKLKTKFGLSNKHTLYGFRHTFVSQLLRSGKSWIDVMNLTGHTQYSSFQKYARSLDSLDPIDLSDGFKVKL